MIRLRKFVEAWLPVRRARLLAERKAIEEQLAELSRQHGVKWRALARAHEKEIDETTAVAAALIARLSEITYRRNDNAPRGWYEVKVAFSDKLMSYGEMSCGEQELVARTVSRDIYHHIVSGRFIRLAEDAALREEQQRMVRMCARPKAQE